VVVQFACFAQAEPLAKIVRIAEGVPDDRAEDKHLTGSDIDRHKGRVALKQVAVTKGGEVGMESAEVAPTGVEITCCDSIPRERLPSVREDGRRFWKPESPEVGYEGLARGI
jgi:hypothetical protein